MIGWTLGRYFALRFLEAVAVVFITCVALVMVVDFVEMLRRAGDAPDISTMSLFLITLYRVPSLTEQIFPFAVLFGALASFLYLSRKLELVVARAAGISAWQFLFPPLLCSVLLGVFISLVYNPISTNLKEEALKIESEVLGKIQNSSPKGNDGFWIRQRSVDGQSILHARLSIDRGAQLSGVTVYTFDVSGRFLERIEAQSARLENGAWKLLNAVVYQYAQAPVEHEAYFLSTNLTLTQVRESLSSPDTVSFWQLPGFIAAMEKAGLPAAKYHLQYQNLLVRPFLMVAMVLVAASFGLRFSRLGGVARMVLFGVVAGFAIYVMTELMEDLGAANIIPVIAAAWLPPMLGVACGVYALLVLEDG